MKGWDGPDSLWRGEPLPRPAERATDDGKFPL